LGIDLLESSNPNVISSDLIVRPIPLPDSSLDVVTARNFIEHVPRVVLGSTTVFPFVNLMNEIHRVLKPNGIFYSRTPAFPMQEAFQDPTHVNIITERTFPCYFCTDQVTGGPWASNYGFTGNFKLESQMWDYCWLMSILRKI
jgi:SAM-dependent methyltransferase